MYLIAPLLYKVINAGVSSLVCALGWTLCCAVFYFAAPSWFDGVEIALLRAPGFIIGMGIGKQAYYKSKVFRWIPALLLVSFPLKLLGGIYDFTFARVINIFYGLLIIVVYCCMRARFTRDELVASPFLCKVGKISYELYLAHVLLRNLLSTVGVNLVNPINYLLCIAVSVPLALGLYRLQ